MRAVWIRRWIDCCIFKEADFNKTFYRAALRAPEWKTIL